MKQFGSFKCILGGAVTELPLIQPLCPKHRYANHQPIHTSFNMHFIMILPFTAFALISRQFSAVFQDTFSLFMQHVIPWFFPISLIWWPPLSRGTYFQRNGILPYTWPICFFFLSKIMLGQFLVLIIAQLGAKNVEIMWTPEKRRGWKGRKRRGFFWQSSGPSR